MTSWANYSTNGNERKMNEWNEWKKKIKKKKELDKRKKKKGRKKEECIQVNKKILNNRNKTNEN